MAGSSRTILFLSAILLIAAAGGMMSSKGESFLLPIVLMLATAAAVMGYGILYGEKRQQKQVSSPSITQETKQELTTLEADEQTIDPVDMGFEIPVL